MRADTVPWEKRFDTEAALTKAMEAFWARGYEATSVQDLLAHMGINRGSLYATFGDKRSLFLRALRHYDALKCKAWIAELNAMESPMAAISAAFDEAIAAALERGSRDGCLLVNTALELSPHDGEIAAIVAHGLREMEAFFRAAIERGQATGEIERQVDPTDAAAALIGLFVGLRVLARSRPEPSLLHAIARQARALIPRPS